MKFLLNLDKFNFEIFVFLKILDFYNFFRNIFLYFQIFKILFLNFEFWDDTASYNPSKRSVETRFIVRSLFIYLQRVEDVT